MEEEGRKYVRIISPVLVLAVRSTRENYIMPGDIYKIIGVMYNKYIGEVPCIHIEGEDYSFTAKDINSFVIIDARDLAYYFLLDYNNLIQSQQIENFFKAYEQELIKNPKKIIDA